jgi:cyclohexyl-isocyanide hydratase
VCNGSLVLGAAGLLAGYRSACHWVWLPLLERFGAVPVAERIVRDRNRISGGGVTAGIDFGLALAAELAGEDVARMIQLALEYDPHPPFAAGSPQGAGPALVERYRTMVAPRLARVEAALADTAEL